jgi:H+/Cl- antiporter ClcA
MGSCELFMPVVFRGAAIGAVMALVMQACGPTPLGAVMRGGIQGNAGSLPHLHNPACQNAVCAGR